PAQEYQAVRSQAGLIDLCHRGLLCFQGPDRISFLQGMVSNDVKLLAPGDGLYAAVLDVSGKVLADVRIFCAGDSLLVDLWEPLKEKVLNHLNRYLVADEVEIMDLSGQYGALSLQGPNSRAIVERLLGTSEVPSAPYGYRSVKIDIAEVGVLRATHTGEEGFDIMIAAGLLPDVISRLEEVGQSFSVRWVGRRALETLRVEAGIPLYGVDMDEGTLLLETGLDHAVSFQKGCYLGQEVVERIRSRGHVNRKLVGLLLDGKEPAERGAKIRSGEKEVGWVTSAVHSPALKRPIALGYVARDDWESGTRLTIHSGSATIPAVVSTLPFYKVTSGSTTLSR
ncbi:MAG: aminomethyl transferase family protein, partial [Deltaproteobacteria bacterium]|nr:aminomethyl transferase family protein [Deltaproteobacteria bacterium]